MSDGGDFFDRLTGKDALRDRIGELEQQVETLEETKEELEQKLDSAEQRRSDALREKQIIAEKRNRLEDRVAELEDRIQKTEETDDSSLKTKTIPYTHVEEFIDRVHSFRTQPEGCCTAAIHSVGQLPEDVEDILTSTAVETIAKRAPCIVLADDLGVCRVLIEPPQGISEEGVQWNDHFVLDKDTFVPTGTFTFALVRSDTFAAAEYTDDQQQEVTTFTSDVKSQHSKGGFSQSRFERRREEQIAEHVSQARTTLQDMPTPQILTGEGTVLNEFDAVSDTAAVDVTGASEEALRTAFHRYWKTRITLL